MKAGHDTALLRKCGMHRKSFCMRTRLFAQHWVLVVSILGLYRENETENEN